MRSLLIMSLFSVFGCEFVELHPCAKADCGLFPEAGIPDATLDGSLSPNDWGLDGGTQTTGRVYLIDRRTGQALSNVPIMIRDENVRTDKDGKAEFVLAPGPFEVSVQIDGALPHRLIGDAQGGQFDQVFFVWPTTLLEELLLSQRLVLDTQKSVLVVALANALGKAALGAKITQTQASDGPFSVSGRTLSPSNQVNTNDDGWFIWPNTLPGQSTLSSIGSSTKPCTRFPGQTPEGVVELKPGEVTHLILVCD